MNPEEFSQLYLPLADGLYRVAFRLLDSQAEAEDAVQDLFIKLWIGRDSLEAVRSPEAWSLTLLRNLCIDRIRARGGTRPEAVPDDLPEPPPPERPEHFDRALQAVRRLSGRERQLLRFRLTEGLSYEEIARRTGQSPKALRVAFHRIKDKLKRQI